MGKPFPSRNDATFSLACRAIFDLQELAQRISQTETGSVGINFPSSTVARILVGLSGGVDSSVAAALLVEQGHEVVGAYMKNWVNDEGIPGECPWEQDIRDALAVAQKIGIEFRVIDLVEKYRARIVNYLIEGYRASCTPNPDVLCNREMKFGVFLDYALEQGFEYVATGHYARRLDTCLLYTSDAADEL